MRTTATKVAFMTIVIPVLHAQEFTVHEDDVPPKKENYSPYVDDHFPQNVYFGDTHLHTSWSADAGLAGTTLGPDLAWRVAKR